MRTFSLINNNGDTYDITLKGTAFFHTITGLGFDRKGDFQQINNSWKELTDELNQQKIEGTVSFFQPDAEEEYFKFAQFCQNGPVIMVYNPGYEEFKRNGSVTKIVRKDGDDCLQCDITFAATTCWYKIGKDYNDGTITGGKVYNYTYNYTYSNSVKGSVRLNSDSYQESPVKLILYGPLTNPVWRYYRNGKLVLTGKVNGNVLTNCKLVIDTTTIPYTMYQLDMLGNYVSDMYQQSDYSTDRFIHFGYGKNIISASADNVSTVNLGVEAQIEYATV